ncbi:MAG: hypothetical protein K9H64_01805 [Bacteroidales bacterium]|nr:hypothetical protein [Bacteroidales bacterium]MCF8454720.1 hypothetical protein [Bacteroidales bacterium]
MLSIQGTYDGKVLRIFDKIQINSPKKVIVTFLEDPDEDFTSEELHMIAQQGGAFDFLDNEEEDIYSDSDLKIKY